jgi:hypothetical protein
LTLFSIANLGFRSGTLNQLLPHTSNRQSRFHHWLDVARRVQPVMARTQAAAELSVPAQRLAKGHPESEKGGGFRFEPAGSLPPRDKASVMMFLAALTLVAILMLCIACANVANIFLAHASGRQREISIRTSTFWRSWRWERRLAVSSG